MTDDAIRRMLGTQDRAREALPEEKPPRLDMSRCVVYPVQKAQEAMGLFKSKYKVEPVLCIASAIGGKTRVDAWVVGYVPENWVDGEAPKL